MIVLAAQRLDLSHPAGIDFTHRNSPTSQKYLIEAMGGGVALLDYNNDGLLDIFLVNSGKLDDPVKLPANFSRRIRRTGTVWYRQNRDGSFTDVTAAAGPPALGTTTAWAQSAITTTTDSRIFTSRVMGGTPSTATAAMERSPMLRRRQASAPAAGRPPPDSSTTITMDGWTCS